MDNELRKRWITLPEVDIEYQSILSVNKRFVSLPDISSDMLRDYIEIGSELINDQLDELREQRRFWDGTQSRPCVYIGRLAVVRSDSIILTKEGQLLDNDDDLTANHLRPAYGAFWSVLARKQYTPEIHRNAIPVDKRLNGTWLGVRKP